MIRHLSGEIRIDGFAYPQDTTRFHILDGKAHQMGASAERLAATAGLVEAIAGLVRDYNKAASKPTPDLKGEQYAIDG
jgi:hypothetical protein